VTSSFLRSLLGSGAAAALTVGALHDALLAIAHLIGLGSPASPAFPARNICLRVAALLREEAGKVGGGSDASGGQSDALQRAEARIAAAASGAASTPSVVGLLDTMPQAAACLFFTGAVRDGLLDGFAELTSDAGMDGFSPALPDLFRPGDVLMLALGSAGRSPNSALRKDGVEPAHALVLELVRAIAGVRPGLEVVVQEGGPGFPGRALAAQLAEPTAVGGRKVNVVLVADASAASLLPRCTKVLLPATAVAADGAVLAPAGSLALALAARAGGVPVYVAASTLALCPEANGGEWGRSAAGTGQQAVSELLPAGTAGCEWDVLAPLREVVPPQLVRFVLTDSGAFSVPGCSQLISELYA